MDDIRVIEKPDWVSWDAIHALLVSAHADNVGQGIVMRNPTRPGDELEEMIGDDGLMFVALDGDRLVGTAAIIKEQGHAWFNKGPYGHLCLAGVLPGYSGRGIYKSLMRRREEYARAAGLPVLVFDTHRKNRHVQAIASANGFRYVGFLRAFDGSHCNVFMAKWLVADSPSRIYCRIRFVLSKLKTLLITGLRDNGKNNQICSKVL